MNTTLNDSHKDIISSYIKAKDENKPHLMRNIFSKFAVLEMDVKTKNIVFPNKTKGLDLIIDLLVKKFNESYENICTFCLSDSIRENNDSTTCSWLVGMTLKGSGELRIGIGTYVWKFDKESTLVNSLIITINEMVILESQHTTLIMNWLNKIPYPWCNRPDINKSMPKLEELSLIKKHNQGDYKKVCIKKTNYT